MKTINASFVMAICLTIAASANAQHYNYKLDGPFTASKSFDVNGVCEMCKHRIENAINTLPGIWSSNWNVDSKLLQVTYDRTKISPDKIEHGISKAGHDTRTFRASDISYENLPDCCHYQRK